MRLEQIHVEGFGTLSGCEITGLSSGMNVIHGVNGAGKTTLLHFISGVLRGFDDARQRRLLPPQRPGPSGGSIRVTNNAGSFEIIRHPRGDKKDTLAISLVKGTANDVSSLRKKIEELPHRLIQSLFLSSGYSSHDLAGLVRLALDHDVELSSRCNSGAWLSERMRAMELEKTSLFQAAPRNGALVSLEQRRDQLAREIDAATKSQLQQLANWQHELRVLRNRIDELTRKRNWFDLEIQAVQCDLTETQDRLWSTQEKTIQEVETVTVPVVKTEPKWVNEIAAIDREIAHVQQVLRDLAASRMHLSMSKADLVGAEVPDVEAILQRQRHSLSIIESQSTQIQAILTQLSDATQCLCGEQSTRVQKKVDNILQQVWLICQEIGRQQSAHEQELLQTQREGVDRCELELVRQVQRLRLRRDHLLHQRGRTDEDRIHFRTAHEAAGCDCELHEQAISQWTAPAVTSAAGQQVIVQERVITVSSARPGDAELEARLLARLAQLRREKGEITGQLRTARIDLQQLELAARELASDHNVQSLRNEYSTVEQQLSDARQQWQSLNLLQTVLQRTQQRLNVEAISPVVKEASGYLERMTDGKYPRLRWSPESKELLVSNGTDSGLPAQALSRGTLEQAVLCFRLALCNEFQRRGVDLPLLLDDVMTDSDEDRTKAAVDVLMDFSKSHQLIFLTCQEHLYNLFANRNAHTLNLPGTPPPGSKSIRPAVVAQASPSPVDAAPTISTVTPPAVASNVNVVAVSQRTQPDEPYWLQTGSAVNHIPSLGEQMSRRLGALGVRTVGELLALDPEASEMPLDALQISRSTLRLWKAEGNLLVCIPNLTGRDAQLLAMCGIQSAADLAACDVTTLFNQIAQIRSRRTLGNTTPWLLQQPEWPSQSQVEQWIRSARNARSVAAATEWSKTRKDHLRNFSPRTSTPSTGRPDPLPPRVVAQPESVSVETSDQWKFYLFTDSPIVDAPSIGPRMAERLNALGIHTVAQLLKGSPNEIARRLNRREVTTDTVADWQHQSRLMCEVPQMRGHDVQVLVTCKIKNAQTLASMSPADLFARIEPFVHSKDGARLLRSSRVPDLEEVTDWISFARKAPAMKAA